MNKIKKDIITASIAIVATLALLTSLIGAVDDDFATKKEER